MSAYTDLVRSACDWADRHPEFPPPAIHGSSIHGIQRVDLTWYLVDNPEQAAIAKAIVDSIGGPSAWKARPNVSGVVHLAGPSKPFMFNAYIAADMQRPAPAVDLDELGVTR